MVRIAISQGASVKLYALSAAFKQPARGDQQTRIALDERLSNRLRECERPEKPPATVDMLNNRPYELDGSERKSRRVVFAMTSAPGGESVE
jgi:hypothetical protein